MSTSKALLIGINYTSIPNNRLKGCINDIYHMNTMIINNYKYLPENIVMLHDDTNNPAALPTYNNIITQLKNIVNASSKCNEIWIHYSGHGSQIVDKNMGNINSLDEIDGLDEVIVPIDYATRGLITDDLIFTIIQNIKCTAMLVFDSCHSATVCDLGWSFENDSGIVTRKQNNKKYIANPNIFMFSGCKDNQNSLDIYNS